MTIGEEEGKDGRRGIPIIDCDISYKQFLDEFLRSLKPCLVSKVTEGWSAVKQWTTLDPATPELIPNFSALEKVFGDYHGCITFCGETDTNGDAIQREMSVSQFIDNFHSNYNHDFFNSTRKSYLKDFHFMRVNPSMKSPYSVPKF